MIPLLCLTLPGRIAAYPAPIARIGSGPLGCVGVVTPTVAPVVSAMLEDYAWTRLTFASIALAAAGNMRVLRRAGGNERAGGADRRPEAGAEIRRASVGRASPRPARRLLHSTSVAHPAASLVLT